ncbi:hypothetical protein N9B85_00520 [bacterium]|nr:hypothetical protein [bacterium]
MIKKITLGITFLFSTLMIASPAYADWERVSKNVKGTYYVDTDRIRNNDSNVYWWELQDLLKPDEVGVLSIKVYHQGDCKVFRLKILSMIFHAQPMGEGSVGTYSPPEPEWMYPSPNSSGETVLKRVCKFAETL